MKKPVVDYRDLRISTICQSQYAHLLLLLGWVGYLLSYVLTEQLIPPEGCYPVRCFLDDWIPFCEIFVIPYVIWYLLIIGTLLYFLLYDVDSFKKLQIYFMICQIISTVIFITFPTRQDLRPEVFPRDNIFSRLVGFLYAADTNTGVCPSLHVALSVGIASVCRKANSVSQGCKLFICVTAVLICLSVVFIKQHSAVDIVAAMPICAIAELLVFRVFFRKQA